MTPLQALQMQLQLQQQLGRQQQQMAGQQNYGANAGNGLERFFNMNTMGAAQRAAAMPAQVWPHSTCLLYASRLACSISCFVVQCSAAECDVCLMQKSRC